MSLTIIVVTQNGSDARLGFLHRLLNLGRRNTDPKRTGAGAPEPPCDDAPVAALKEIVARLRYAFN